MIIKFYNGSSKLKMGLRCQECRQPIGTKPCVLIMTKDNVYVWYCENCVIVKGFTDWVR